MELKVSIQDLRIQIMGDLNYIAVRELKQLLRQQEHFHSCLELNLSFAKFIDSEGIRFLYLLVQHNYKVRLLNPPDLFQEAVQLLGLEETLLPLIQTTTTVPPN